MRSLLTLLYISLSVVVAEYISTYVYPDTPDQCADYVVHIADSISPASSCVQVNGQQVNGQDYGSYWIRCVNDTTYSIIYFTDGGCSSTNSSTTYVQFSNSVCTYMGNPSIFNTPGFVVQTCLQKAPQPPEIELPTLVITEYKTPYCNEVNSLTPASTNTTFLNQCQNSGGGTPSGATSFMIECNSTTAYVSYYSEYGCLATNILSVSPLFQIGCSNVDSSTTVSVSCSSGSSPPPPPPSPSPNNNNIWQIITQSPYFINGLAVGAGLLGGGIVVCICLCFCRRRKAKKPKRNTTSPNTFNTSIQSDSIIVDGTGTPLRKENFPGIGYTSPSVPMSQAQTLRTPLLSSQDEVEVEEGGEGYEEENQA
jgi:hypothetical protein